MMLPSLSTTASAAPRRVPVWALFLIALVGFAVYANSLKNEFAFDDTGIVSGNTHVVNLEWTTIWTDGYWPRSEGLIPDALYRPLTIWSYAANQAILPNVAWPFHLVNILLNCLVSVLVALLAWRLLGNRAVAILTGLLFAVHPLHTEVVANVVGRAEILAMFWSLLALLIFLPQLPLADAAPPTIGTSRPLWQVAVISVAALAGCLVGARLAPADTLMLPDAIYGSALGVGAGLLVAGVMGYHKTESAGFRPWWHGMLVALCLLAAMLCKETPVMMILAFMFIDAWRFARWNPAARPTFLRWFSAQAVRYYAPIYAAMGVYARLRIPAVGIMSGTAVTHRVVNPLIGATLPERIVTPFMLLAKYLLLTFWPAHLSADYSAPSLMPTSSPFYATAFQPPAALGILVCVLALVIAVMAWKKAPQIAIILVLFLTSYFLVANVVRIGTIMGERLFYWPSAFVIMLVAWAGVAAFKVLTTAPEGMPAPSPATIRGVHFAALAAVALATGAMSVRTWARNPDWAENTALAISTARDNPDSGKACTWAGSTLAMSQDPRFADFGRTLMERGIELTPDYVVARWELAKYYGMRHQLGKSVIYLAQAAEINPARHQTRAAMESVLIDLRIESPDLYMPVILDYQKDHSDEPSIYLALALAYHAQHQWDLAEQNARKAIDLRAAKNGDGMQQFHEAGAELASIQYDRGNIDQGISSFSKYLIWMGGSTDARATYAHMLLGADLIAHPQFLEAAEKNLDFADMVEPHNAKTRRVRGELDRLWASLDTNPVPNAIDHLTPLQMGPPAALAHEPAGGVP